MWDGYTLAAKIFDKSDREWLKERFAMLDDFLRDSPAYEDVRTAAKAEGKAEGLAEGIETGKMEALSQTKHTLSQMLLNRVNDRFPALENMARVCAEKINNTEILLDLIIKISLIPTEQEAKNILDSTW